jgi:hypothetical protein
MRLLGELSGSNCLSNGCRPPVDSSSRSQVACARLACDNDATTFFIVLLAATYPESEPDVRARMIKANRSSESATIHTPPILRHAPVVAENGVAVLEATSTSENAGRIFSRRVTKGLRAKSATQPRVSLPPTTSLLPVRQPCTRHVSC